ncbi:MAG: nuclear transport factor 2 family protein [Acidobacteriaceae bacterium]
MFDRRFRRAGGALVLLPGLFFAFAQPQKTHRYDLRDPALARAAQRYDWAQEGKGNRPELEKLVADNYELVRASGRVTNKAGLIDLICHPGSYTNPYTVEAPFVRDLGDTVILGGWVRITGTDGGKPFEQKARFADIWHKGEKGWQLTYTQVTLADAP